MAHRIHSSFSVGSLVYVITGARYGLLVISGLHTANLCLMETGITQLKYCQEIFQAVLSPIITQLVWYK